MARIINGVLFVPAFTQTAPGEYDLGVATYVNVADATGNGANDVQIGYIVYAGAAEVATGDPVTGVVHRYRIDSLTHIDASSFSGHIVWDEDGTEVDMPLNGVWHIISEASSNFGYGFPSAEAVYPQLNPGSTVAAQAADLRRITDKPTEKILTENFIASDWIDVGGGSYELSIIHNFGSAAVDIISFQKVGVDYEVIEISAEPKLNTVLLHIDIPPFDGRIRIEA